MRRWLRLSLSYPFERWAQSVEQRRRVRVVLQKCARRLANRSVAAAFLTWSDFGEAKRGAAERRALNLIRRMTRLDRRVRVRRVVGRGEARFGQEGGGASAADAMAERARRVFDTWAAHVRESRSRRVALRKTLARIRNVKLNAAWIADGRGAGRRQGGVASREAAKPSRFADLAGGAPSASDETRRGRCFAGASGSCTACSPSTSASHFVAWLDSFRHRRQGVAPSRTSRRGGADSRSSKAIPRVGPRRLGTNAALTFRCWRTRLHAKRARGQDAVLSRVDAFSGRQGGEGR